MPVVLVPAGLLLGLALFSFSALAGIGLIILAALLAAYLFKKILVTLEAIYAKYARSRAGTKNLTIADVRDLTAHAVRKYIDEHPESKLRFSDPYNEHPAQMYMGPVYQHYRDHNILRSSSNSNSNVASFFGLVYITEVTRSQRSITAEAALFVTYDNKIHFIVPTKSRHLQKGQTVPDFRDCVDFATYDLKKISRTMMVALKHSLTIERPIDAQAERAELKAAAKNKAADAAAIKRANDLAKLKSKL